MLEVRTGVGVRRADVRRHRRRSPERVLVSTAVERSRCAGGRPARSAAAARARRRSRCSRARGRCRGRGGQASPAAGARGGRDRAVGTVSAVAVVRPFRALRYDELVAGPLERSSRRRTTSSDGAARALRGRSPYNVVHLTLPDSEEEAAASLADGASAASSYGSPSRPAGGSRRTTSGRTASRGAARASSPRSALEPYDERVVLPHERTHAGPKEGRLRLLRATRTQLEPLFFLWDGTIEVDGLGEPDLRRTRAAVVSQPLAARRRVRRRRSPRSSRDAQLLIADGHHRYETALAFHAEDGSEESAWLLAVIVPTDQEGLTIFPTHRVAQSAGDGCGDADRPVPARSCPARSSTAQGRYELLAGDGSRPGGRRAGSRRAASRTRRSARRRSPRSTAARRRRRSCCARRGSRTSGRSRAAAT